MFRPSTFSCLVTLALLGASGPAAADELARQLRPQQLPAYQIVVPNAAVATQAWMDRSSRVYLPGERARIFVRTQRDAYVTVINVDADGVARVIFPNCYTGQNANFVRAGQPLSIPNAAPGQQGWELVAAEPYGGNLLKIVTSAVPLTWSRWAPASCRADAPFPRVADAADQLGRMLQARPIVQYAPQQSAQQQNVAPQPCGQVTAGCVADPIYGVSTLVFAVAPRGGQLGHAQPDYPPASPGMAPQATQVIVHPDGPNVTVQGAPTQVIVNPSSPPMQAGADAGYGLPPQAPPSAEAAYGLPPAQPGAEAGYAQGPQGAPYVATLPIPDAPNDFDLRLELAQPGYRLGEKMMVRVTPERRCKLTLLDVGQDGTYEVLVPNAFSGEIWLPAQRMTSIPAADARFDLKALQGGERRLLALCGANRTLSQLFSGRDGSRQATARQPTLQEIMRDQPKGDSARALLPFQVHAGQ